MHPIDSENAPYNFSSTTNPDLHNAARALNLPPRSTKSYLSLFDSASHSTPRNRSAVNSLEERYSGSFLISGYNVCYVLPKEFPANHKLRAGTDSDGDGLSSRGPSRRSSSRAGRRSSISERNVIQFMAALSLWIPFASKVRLVLNRTKNPYANPSFSLRRHRTWYVDSNLSFSSTRANIIISSLSHSLAAFPIIFASAFLHPTISVPHSPPWTLKMTR